MMASPNPMPEVTYIQPDDTAVTLEVPAGTSLMRGAVDAAVEGIEAQCGGMCSCATCHCYVDPAWLGRLPPPSAGEMLMLTNVAAERRTNSRLSCQINSDASLDGIVVRFPERQS
jgi:2Fe-2S ferredoxin